MTKTIWAGVVGVVVGVGGLVSGLMEADTAGQYILGGITAIFLRLGIKKALK